ncbi:MAG TPA: T9SS type A sorting domain-containing protein, partial [Bacteroidales bacterium]|nr:T9SS type A sorting domain-containing protein [Bacteroidales bacterium]
EEVNPQIITNNYYDKQMCLSKGIADADVPNSAEGKLTNQLTGTSPELQAMLGDGWSYAEGRYPIPLGLENDSMALVAATPVYLHFETEEDYNHVDSVTKNFIVGLENNVSWDDANGRVSFSDENVTLLSVGIENITVSLGDYSKNVRINIVDIETSVPNQTIENRITAYPNPAGEFISLNLNGINAERVDVYDITGKLLSTNNLCSEQTLIFTGNLHSGLYFIKVYNGNQNIAILKIIKR